MKNKAEELKMRVMFCFLENPDSTVTGISRTLNEPKQTISRMLMALEKEGLINRENNRHPKLTSDGEYWANLYNKRMNINLHYLMYNGVNIEDAREDAMYFALHSSDATMRMIAKTTEILRIKSEPSMKRKFSGDWLCNNLSDGIYNFPFIIYKEIAKNGNNISMANRGFVHPCTITVKNGVGIVQLQAVAMSEKSSLNGETMTGKVKNMRYFSYGEYIQAETIGDLITFPATALEFVTDGTGSEKILHGSVGVNMECSVGPEHMAEATAIFTVII